MSLSAIEWCDKTWNPVRGCSRVSRGCEHCYAERIAARFSTHAQQDGDEPGGTFAGFAEQTSSGPHWTGRVELIPSKLDEPLRWKKPARVFVNSMSDLFHEKLAATDILRVFLTMIEAPQHTFQILTKRPERMQRLVSEWLGPALVLARSLRAVNWPGSNVWLGVSVEDQKTADERIPLLLQTPAAVRFVSYEPALGPVDFSRYLLKDGSGVWETQPTRAMGGGLSAKASGLIGESTRTAREGKPQAGSNPASRLHWIIVGGESGPGARPFDIAWARSAIAQCRAAGVPVFYKQGGSSHRCPHSSKGGHIDCFPSDLQIREFPNA